MLNRIMDFLVHRQAEPESGTDQHSEDELQLAAAALMVEAARMDDTVDDAERTRIVELVRWRFSLSEDEATAVVDRAVAVTDSGPANWFGFAATVRRAFDDSERLRLIEMLWDIVYSDGRVHHLEASLMRRIAGLLEVSDRDSGAARQRARQRHGLDDTAQS